jgi:hypothetical protein
MRIILTGQWWRSVVGLRGLEPRTSSSSDPTRNYDDVIRGCEAAWGIMGNAQLRAAVGAQAASQLMTIPTRLFRSFQGEVAARLLRTHFTTAAPKRRGAPQPRFSGFGQWWGARRSGRPRGSKGYASAEYGRRRGRSTQQKHPGALLSCLDFDGTQECTTRKRMRAAEGSHGEDWRRGCLLGIVAGNGPSGGRGEARWGSGAESSCRVHDALEEHITTRQ